MEKQTIIFDFYRTLYNPKSGSLYRGTRKLLKSLSEKYNLILITTWDSKRDSQISNLSLKKFFKSTIICVQKTTTLFSKFSLNRNLTLIVGDRKDSEISIGQKLKIKTLLVNPDSENPTVTLRKFLKNYGKI